MMSNAERLRKWLEDQDGMQASIGEACKALDLRPEQIHEAEEADYWIITGVWDDTGQPYVALEGE